MEGVTNRTAAQGDKSGMAAALFLFRLKVSRSGSRSALLLAGCTALVSFECYPMRKIFLLAWLLSISSALANDVVVFGKGNFILLKPGVASPAPQAPAKAAFLVACQADLLRPTAAVATFPLGSPPEWGKTIKGASGAIKFHDSFRGGFRVHVTLEGLAPDHLYILTLNGKPGLAGNERLVDVVPGMEKEQERYMDFMKVTTDAHGRYEATYGIALLPGPYGVRFYVKDTDDFKIVLYHDYFKFKVE